MKRFLFFLAFIPVFCFSQEIDTVIVTPVYTSYFSYQTRSPLFVAYKLYRGGGDFSRSGMSFTKDGLKQSDSSKDYAKSGYDIGHMANAEDFAYDCDKERITFRFYNALPQLPKLNRGIWKKVETKVRKQSQMDSLLIVCGGYSFRKIGRLNVPEYCFKIVKSLRTGVVKAYLFKNDRLDACEEVKVNVLLKNIPFKENIERALN